jgi:flagellar protein FliS
MALAQLAKSYKSAAVSTATPGQLVLMLFDGALRFLSQALHGFEIEHISQRQEQIHNSLVKTQAIVRELQCSLDLKVGGEFATTMYALYDYMMDQLRTANMQKDPEPIRIVERLFGEIRDAWAQMLQQNAAPIAA